MRRVVVCVPMVEEVQKTIIQDLKKSYLIEDAEVTFLYVFKQENYGYMIPPHIFPDGKQKEDIEAAVLDILKTTGEGVLEGQTDKKADFKCFFDYGPKERVVEFLKEVGADLVITATRGKHGIEGLFSSSFTDHLVKHAPCNVLTLRHSS